MESWIHFKEPIYYSVLTVILLLLTYWIARRFAMRKMKRVVMKAEHNYQQQIANLQKRMLQAVSLFYERFKRRFDLAVNARVFKNPQTLTQEKEQELDELSLRLTNAWAEKLTQFTHRFDVARQKLNALGPQAVLKRGYSITRKADGSVISHVAQTAPGETIYIQVQDGMIHTEVK